MKKDQLKIEEVLRLPPSSLKEMEQVLDRIFDRLRSNTGLNTDHGHEAASVQSNPIPRPRWTWAAMLAAAALVTAVVWIGFSWQSRYGTLETADGASHWIYQGSTFGDGGGLLTLRDGSRVEIRGPSDLSLERADDGVRILLSNGGVIVDAEKQREGRHLYVQTKDVMVSVVGTVFLVNAEEAGSRVAVIQGEVRVQGGAALRVLLPGQQVATASSRDALPIAEEISWSRQALAHSTLLQQSAAAAAAAPTRPEFEVSVVRANVSGSTSSRMEHKQDRVTISNATLEEIIRYAYSDRNARMSGPGLLRSGRYDIEAKAPSGTPDALLLPLLQTLLTDRFEMRLHRETIEMPVYALVVAKDGHKLKEVQPGGVSGAGSGITPRVDGLASTMFIGDMASFATSLSRGVDRPVVDQTRLSGRFNVALSYVPDRLLALGETPGPSIFSALQEQLGLKLEPQQGSIEMIVIDDIQEPNPN